MNPTQIRSLIAKYIMGNYNAMDDDEWINIRNQLITLRISELKDYRSAVLDIIESTMRLLEIQEYDKKEGA